MWSEPVWWHFRVDSPCVFSLEAVRTEIELRFRSHRKQMRFLCWMRCPGLIPHGRGNRLFSVCPHTASDMFTFPDAGLWQSVGVKFSLCRQLSWETDTCSISHLPDATAVLARSAGPGGYVLARKNNNKSLSTRKDEATAARVPLHCCRVDNGLQSL